MSLVQENPSAGPWTWIRACGNSEEYQKSSNWDCSPKEMAQVQVQVQVQVFEEFCSLVVLLGTVSLRR